MSHSWCRIFLVCQSKIICKFISVSFALHRATIDTTTTNVGITLHANKKLHISKIGTNFLPRKVMCLERLFPCNWKCIYLSKIRGTNIQMHHIYLINFVFVIFSRGIITLIWIITLSYASHDLYNALPISAWQVLGEWLHLDMHCKLLMHQINIQQMFRDGLPNIAIRIK